jgi:hypothetical protein
MTPAPSQHDRPRYWFPAKRYGWGWGPPATWQGWVVLGAWVAVLIPVSVFLAPRSLLLYYLALAAMCAALVGIAYAKGEPPRWRWGDRG